jgi:hypothetical protein
MVFPIREAIRKNKLLPFGHFPNGGGVQPKCKSFEVFFLALFLSKTGFLGVQTPSKSFEVVMF